MPFSGPRLPKGSFAGAADLAVGWEAWFGEALFLREVVVFDEGKVVVGVEFGEEEVLHKTDLGFEALKGEGRIGRWWGQGGGEVEGRAGWGKRLVGDLGCEEMIST